MYASPKLSRRSLLRLVVGPFLWLITSGGLIFAFEDPHTRVKAESGGRIVTVTTMKDDGKEWVVALDPATSRWEKIVAVNHSNVRLSPDGTTVAYGSGVKILTCPLKAGAKPKEIGEIGDPKAMQDASVALAWTHDGSSIYATGVRGIFPDETYDTRCFRLRGGAATKVPIPESDAIDDITSDSRWLLTSRTRKGLAAGVSKIRLDGTGELPLARQGAFCGRFSPDGTKILYCGYFDAGGETGGLYLIDADGSNRRQLHPSPAYGCWSPDGKRIALTGVGAGFPVAIEKAVNAPLEDKLRIVGRIVVIDLDGKNRAVYPTPGGAFAFQPDWR
jgi:WD40-like Beta Propeller Repeat